MELLVKTLLGDLAAFVFVDLAKERVYGSAALLAVVGLAREILASAERTNNAWESCFRYLPCALEVEHAERVLGCQARVRRAVIHHQRHFKFGDADASALVQVSLRGR